jgi:hypothetical protein
MPKHLFYKLASFTHYPRIMAFKKFPGLVYINIIHSILCKKSYIFFFKFARLTKSFMAISQKKDRFTNAMTMGIIKLNFYYHLSLETSVHQCKSLLIKYLKYYTGNVCGGC